jgi:hypothetical protein
MKTQEKNFSDESQIVKTCPQWLLDAVEPMFARVSNRTFTEEVLAGNISCIHRVKMNTGARGMTFKCQNKEGILIGIIFQMVDGFGIVDIVTIIDKNSIKKNKSAVTVMRKALKTVKDFNLFDPDFKSYIEFEVRCTHAIQILTLQMINEGRN